MTSPAPSEVLYSIAAQFAAGDSRCATFCAPGDAIRLVRDESRHVVVTLAPGPALEGPPASSSGVTREPQLLLSDWEGRFSVSVNEITYEKGPVLLSAGDVIQLCRPKTFEDSHSFKVFRGVPPPPASEEEERGTPPSSSFKAGHRDVDMFYVEECAKWNNFYSYRYSTTNFALEGEARGRDDRAASEWRRFIGLRPEEGCPNIFVVTQVRDSDVFPPSNQAETHDSAAVIQHEGPSSCGGAAGCTLSFCETCRHIDAGTKKTAKEHTQEFLLNLKKSLLIPDKGASDGVTGSQSKKNSVLVSHPWRSYCHERRLKLGLPAPPAAAGAGMSRPSAPARQDPSSPLKGTGGAVDVKALCERIERLETLLTRPTYV